jgi:hypothetical protein
MIEYVLALLLWSFAPEPPRDIQADRLEAHILRVYPGCTYARELAEGILTSAAEYGLDPAMLAAIAWTESGYRNHVRGSAQEVSLWQHIPGGWLAEAWDEIRGHRPPWRRLSRWTRERHCKHIQTGIHFAAWMLDWHLQRCGSHEAACYARHQSGRAWVSRDYVQRLVDRSGAVRGRLSGE